jgi:hypothetical protein
MKKLFSAVFLILALPILFSGQQRIKSPTTLTAVACEMSNIGNYCDSERDPSRPFRTGKRNGSGESGTAGTPIGVGAGLIALMFLTWAMRL